MMPKSLIKTLALTTFLSVSSPLSSQSDWTGLHQLVGHLSSLEPTRTSLVGNEYRSVVSFELDGETLKAELVLQDRFPLIKNPLTDYKVRNPGELGDNIHIRVYDQKGNVKKFFWDYDLNDPRRRSDFKRYIYSINKSLNTN